MTLVERIKALADSHHLTIAALERDCGFGNGTIRKWDWQSPSVDRALKVANRLGVSLNYLVTGFDEALTDNERQLIALYRSLPAYDQKNCYDIAKMMADRIELKTISSCWDENSGETA